MADISSYTDAYDPNQTPSFDPLPKGEYIAMLVKSDGKETASGGYGVNCQWQIVDGEYSGRMVFDFLNLNCPTSDMAQGIARNRLAAMKLATGCVAAVDTSEMHNIPCLLKVGVRVDKQTQQVRNTVQDVAPADAPKKAASQPPRAPQQPPRQSIQPPVSQATNGGGRPTPPWAKR